MGGDCTEVRLAHSKADIAACYPIMKQLRPDQPWMENVSSFTSIVWRMERMERMEGYQLVCLVQQETNSTVAGAGYRIGESLFIGKEMFVQDLVTDAAHRSKGYGHVLLSWLADQAVLQNCNKLWLASGMQRVDAHRFYEKHGMTKAGYFFPARCFGVRHHVQFQH